MRSVIATTAILSMLSCSPLQAQDKANVDPAVSLFDAMESGKIDVKFVPQNMNEGRVIISNQTDQPLHIQLPATFGAVPVLAQFNGPLGNQGNGIGLNGNGNGVGLNGNGQGQQLGGGFGQQGFGQQGFGQGQGFGRQGLGNGLGNFGGNRFGQGALFRIDPGKTRKLNVATLCLEHGKPNPTPRMKYSLVPLQQVNDDPVIEKLCSDLGEGKISKGPAQALSWHVANGLGWEELASKHRKESRYTGNENYFSSADLNAARSWLARQDRESMNGTSRNNYDAASKSNSKPPLSTSTSNAPSAKPNGIQVFAAASASGFASASAHGMASGFGSGASSGSNASNAGASVSGQGFTAAGVLIGDLPNHPPY